MDGETAAPHSAAAKGDHPQATRSEAQDENTGCTQDVVTAGDVEVVVGEPAAGVSAQGSEGSEDDGEGVGKDKTETNRASLETQSTFEHARASNDSDAGVHDNALHTCLFARFFLSCRVSCHRSVFVHIFVFLPPTHTHLEAHMTTRCAQLWWRRRGHLPKREHWTTRLTLRCSSLLIFNLVSSLSRSTTRAFIITCIHTKRLITQQPQHVCTYAEGGIHGAAREWGDTVCIYGGLLCGACRKALVL